MGSEMCIRDSATRSFLDVTVNHMLKYSESHYPGSKFSFERAAQNIGCFPLCQTDRSEISGTTQGKWNDIFRLNRANQKPTNRNSSCHFLSFPNSLIRAKNRFVKNGTANFDRNIPTEISGPPPEVIPNIPVVRNRNGPFHLNSDRNFRNLWHIGKHPMSPFYCFIFTRIYIWVVRLWSEDFISLIFLGKKTDNVISGAVECRNFNFSFRV